MFTDSTSSPKKKPARSLRWTLALNFAAVAFLPVILITCMVLYQFITDKANDLAEKNLLIARAVRGQVEVFLREPVAVLQNIRNMIILDPSINDNGIKMLLKSHVRHSPLLESIYVIGSNGTVSCVGFKPEKEAFEKDYIGISLAHKDFYQKALASRNPTWSDTFLSLISGKMSLALCLIVDDRVLVGNFNIDLLSSFINKINVEKGIVITLVDRGGAIVVQSGNLAAGRQVKINHLELFRKGLAGIEGTQHYTLDDINYIGSVAGIPGPGWVAAVSQKTADLYQPLVIVGVYIVASAAGILILSILFGVISSRKLSKPLTEFSHSAKVVAKGKYETKWDQPSYIEVLDLASSFQSMVESIQDREQRLKNSERRYRMLFEKTNDAIFVVERHTGRYLDTNEAGVRLSGRTLSELKKLNTKDVTPFGAEDRLESIATAQETLNLGKVVYQRPDGTKRIAMLTSVPIDSRTIIGIARDISDEMAMEDHLRQAQKLEAIGTLAGGIAHDFNNILSGIFGYTQLLQMKMQKDSDMLVYLDSIFKAGNRAKNLVKQILTFSRQSVNVLTPTEIQLVIKEALKLIESSIPSTISIRQKIQNDCGVVLADHTQIHQIIMNLCTNAYHAMEETGGELTVILREAELTAEISKDQILNPGKYVHLTVADTGTGMDRGVIDRIFDPYFTTKEEGKGTGLGLAVIHGIIKSHGGQISVDSEPGKGTKFHIYLPLINAVQETEYVKDHMSIKKGSERILLVDDQKDVVEIEQQMLEALGYEVTVKISSVDALNTFRVNPDSFDLVITDMTMPNMTGEKLAGELIQIRPNIPVILCTGFSEIISKEKAAALGINGFLMKPIVIKDLSNMIRGVLDNKDNSGEG